MVRSRQAGFFYCTVRVNVESRIVKHSLIHESESGTAFLVVEKAAGKVVMFLVTARHVVEGAQAGSLFFLRGKLGEHGEATYEFHRSENFGKLWFFHENADIDVAVAPILDGSPILDELTEKLVGVKGFGIRRSESLLPYAAGQLTDVPEVSYFEDVVFLGYPTGIYDHVHGFPILRRALTASPMMVDYEGRPEFLVDGAVWEGSSGSPVVILDQQLYIKGGKFKGDPNYDHIEHRERFVFLGMLTDRLILRNASKHVNINLGSVVKASAVFETIDRWIQNPEPTA